MERRAVVMACLSWWMTPSHAGDSGGDERVAEVAERAVSPEVPLVTAEVSGLTAAARAAAERGDCALARDLADRARQVDPSHPLLRDPAIAACQQPTSSPRRSPAVAAALSITPTLVGGGLLTAGLVIANERPLCRDGYVCTDPYREGLPFIIAGSALLAIGPTLGHTYSGRTWNRGLKVRLVGMAIGGLGVGIGFACDNLRCAGMALSASILVGGGTVLVGTAIELATVRQAARGPAPQLALAPLRTTTGTVPALVLHTTF